MQKRPEGSSVGRHVKRRRRRRASAEDKALAAMYPKSLSLQAALRGKRFGLVVGATDPFDNLVSDEHGFYRLSVYDQPDY